MRYVNIRSFLRNYKDEVEELDKDDITVTQFGKPIFMVMSATTAPTATTFTASNVTADVRRALDICSVDQCFKKVHRFFGQKPLCLSHYEQAITEGGEME